MSQEQARIHEQRWRLSKRYIFGKGLEIGALNRPLPTHKVVQVIYVDRTTVDDAYNVHFPGLKGVEIANVDVIDDAEELHSIPPESQDFIIASHFLEHTQNPIKTIETHLGRIRVGGILYYVLPDKRFTFDIDRPVTTFEHLLSDYNEGPEKSYESHLYEFVEFVYHAKTKEQVENLVKNFKNAQSRIHFHAWDAKSLKEFFEKTNEVLGNSYSIVEFEEDEEYENLVILRKTKSKQMSFGNLGTDSPLAIRELMRVYNQRVDLQRAFPEVKERNHLTNLISWARQYGLNEDSRLYRFSPYFDLQPNGDYVLP